MSRFLIVVPPLLGHVNPTVGIGQIMRERGHQVAWTGPALTLRPLLGNDAQIYPTGMRAIREQAEHGLASIKSVWEGFIVPYARFTLPALDKAVLDYSPDVIIVDQHSPAGALVAHRHGVRWVSLTSSAMEISRPFITLPKVEAWIHEKLVGLWQHAGLPEQEFIDPRFSPELVISLSSPALTGAATFPDHYAFTGPILAERPSDVAFPWDRLDPDRQHVLVTMGSLAVGRADDFHRRALEALRPLGNRIQGIIVTAPEMLPPLPAHMLAVPQVPMLELLPHIDAVVCHSGMNTVCETLGHGLPLVMAPMKNDQPITANQVVAAGAGIRVQFSRVTPEQLRSTIIALLDDPSYRLAAQRIRDQFARDGGAHSVVELLEKLIAS